MTMRVEEMYAKWHVQVLEISLPRYRARINDSVEIEIQMKNWLIRMATRIVSIRVIADKNVQVKG